MTLPIKLAVLAEVLPPAPFYGHVVLLYRMLKDLDPDDYCLISDRSHESGTPPDGSDSTPRLPARYHYLRPDGAGSGRKLSDEPEGANGKDTPIAGLVCDPKPSIFASLRSKVPGWLKRRVVRSEFVGWMLTARKISGESLACFRRASGTARVVRQEGSGAVVACSGDPFDLPAGYLAARLARVPFYAYLFDDYLYQWKSSLYCNVARVVEPTCIRGAADVIVPNEFVRDEYRRRYRGVEPVVVRNAFEVPEIEERVAPDLPMSGREVRVLYTGTVYHAHYDAFRNLLAAIRRLGRPDVKLHIYTTQTREELEREGIGGQDVVLHEHLASSEVFEEQRRADILFLPLAFDSPFPELIRTSCPMKTGEYLASGRPILVHAPADSFLCWYFTRHECGVVVDRRDPEELAQAIRRIRDDASLRETIGRNARARAVADFDLTLAREEFVKVFGAKG